MTTSTHLSRIAALAFSACALALSGCDREPSPAPEPPAGRYAIVSADGLTPGTRETFTIDTATGATWRLVKSTAPGSQDDVGWHPVADLTIESRSPYYRLQAGSKRTEVGVRAWTCVNSSGSSPLRNRQPAVSQRAPTASRALGCPPAT